MPGSLGRRGKGNVPSQTLFPRQSPAAAGRSLWGTGPLWERFPLSSRLDPLDDGRGAADRIPRHVEMQPNGAPGSALVEGVLKGTHGAIVAFSARGISASTSAIRPSATSAPTSCVKKTLFPGPGKRCSPRRATSSCLSYSPSSWWSAAQKDRAGGGSGPPPAGTSASRIRDIASNAARGWPTSCSRWARL